MQHEGLAQMCCLIRAPRKTFSTARPSEHRREMSRLNSKRLPSQSYRRSVLRPNTRKVWASYSSSGLCWQLLPACIRRELGDEGSTAMTLVPTAPPGGRGRSNPEGSRSTRHWFEVDEPGLGGKAFQMKSMQRASRSFFLSVLSLSLLSPPW